MRNDKDSKMPSNKQALIVRYNQWVIVDQRKRKEMSEVMLRYHHEQQLLATTTAATATTSGEENNNKGNVQAEEQDADLLQLQV